MHEHPEKLTPPVERAIEYRRLGLNPLPLVATRHGVPGSGKAPAIRWKDLQRTPETLAGIEAWFAEHPEWNVGLVTGADGKIVVVDADSAVAVDFVHARLPQTPMQVVTGKGIHFYYRHPGHHIPNNVRLREMPLDVRGDGGVVATAESEHWTGHVYRFVEEPTAAMLAELPPFDPAWLADDPPRAQRSIDVDSVESRIRLIRRAVLYIDKCEPAVSGQAGHNKMFATACKLLDAPPRGFGLNVAEATPILTAYNLRCQPPFSDRELEHKITSVLARMQKS